MGFINRWLGGDRRGVSPEELAADGGEFKTGNNVKKPYSDREGKFVEHRGYGGQRGRGGKLADRPIVGPGIHEDRTIITRDADGGIETPESVVLLKEKLKSKGIEGEEELERLEAKGFYVERAGGPHTEDEAVLEDESEFDSVVEKEIVRLKEEIVDLKKNLQLLKDKKKNVEVYEYLEKEIALKQQKLLDIGVNSVDVGETKEVNQYDDYVPVEREEDEDGEFVLPKDYEEELVGRQVESNQLKIREDENLKRKPYKIVKMTDAPSKVGMGIARTHNSKTMDWAGENNAKVLAGVEPHHATKGSHPEKQPRYKNKRVKKSIRDGSFGANAELKEVVSKDFERGQDNKEETKKLNLTEEIFIGGDKSAELLLPIMKSGKEVESNIAEIKLQNAIYNITKEGDSELEKENLAELRKVLLEVTQWIEKFFGEREKIIKDRKMISDFVSAEDEVKKYLQRVLYYEPDSFHSGYIHRYDLSVAEILSTLRDAMMRSLTDIELSSSYDIKNEKDRHDFSNAFEKGLYKMRDKISKIGRIKEEKKRLRKVA